MSLTTQPWSRGHLRGHQEFMALSRPQTHFSQLLRCRKTICVQFIFSPIAKRLKRGLRKRLIDWWNNGLLSLSFSVYETHPSSHETHIRTHTYLRSYTLAYTHIHAHTHTFTLHTNTYERARTHTHTRRVVGNTMGRGADDPSSLLISPVRLTSPSFPLLHRGGSVE